MQMSSHKRKMQSMQRVAASDTDIQQRKYIKRDEVQYIHL